MTIAERIRADLTVAMKAGEKERVGALRLVLSELQKAAKEGSSDELAVLRRERKRRRDAESAFEAAGRAELAAQEAAEAALIESYLPQELTDEELDEVVRRAIAETGAEGPKAVGQVIRRTLELTAGRADGRRVSTRVREYL